MLTEKKIPKSNAALICYFLEVPMKYVENLILKLSVECYVTVML